MRHRRVAVNHEFAVVQRRVEKLVTNPEQIVVVLLLAEAAGTTGIGAGAWPEAHEFQTANTLPLLATMTTSEDLLKILA